MLVDPEGTDPTNAAGVVHEWGSVDLDCGSGGVPAHSILVGHRRHRAAQLACLPHDLARPPSSNRSSAFVIRRRQRQRGSESRLRPRASRDDESRIEHRRSYADLPEGQQASKFKRSSLVQDEIPSPLLVLSPSWLLALV